MPRLRDRMTEDLRLRGLADRTIDSYVSAVAAMQSHFGRSPAKLTQEEVRSYLVYLAVERKVARGTHTIALCAIKFFYETTLSREWKILEVARPPRQNRLPVVLSREEVWRILDCVNIPVYRGCLTTIYSCGLRLMEGAKLSIPQIDSDRNLLLIHGKGNKDRYVPIQDSALEMLRELWKTHRSQMWLFPTPTRKGMKHSVATNAGHVTRSSLQGAFRRALDKSGVRKKAHVHTLRHSYATHLLELGVSTRVVQSHLGHRYVRTTERYLHLTRKVRDTAKDPLDRLWDR